jgi:hypothetical protein
MWSRAPNLKLLTTMQIRESSLLLREATAIQIDLAQLGFPYHTTYAGLGLQTRTYIYQPSLGSSNMRTGPTLSESTVLHLPTSFDFADS